MAANAAKPDTATAHNNFARMVILGLPGAWRTKNPYPSAATACDNGDPSKPRNILTYILTGKTRFSRLHSSTVQHRSATLRPSSTRGASHDDIILPRCRDRHRIPVPDGFRIRTDPRAG